MARPSVYTKEYHDKAGFKLALLGLTDKQMADVFNVSEQTLNNWKIANPSFLESLNKGKDEADAQVVKSLYKRAIGFKYKEVHFEDIQERVDHPEGGFHFEEKTRVKTVYKRQAPDVTAQIFWLKNRQPEKWRDKQEVEHKGEVKGNFVVERKIVKRDTNESEGADEPKA